MSGRDRVIALAWLVAFPCACSMLVSSEGLTGGPPPMRRGASNDANVEVPSDGDVPASDGEATADGAGQGGDGGPGFDASNGDANTVVCAPACDSGTTCLDGVCRPSPIAVVSGGTGIVAVAVTPGDLYYGRIDQLLRKPFDAGLAAFLGDLGAKGDMVVDDAWVYVPDNGVIYRVPLGGGPSETVHTAAGSPIRGVTVLGSELFYTFQNQLLAVPKTPGAVAAQTRATGFASAMGVCAAGDIVLVADAVAGKVYSVPPAGGTPTPIADVPEARSVFVEGGDLFVSTLSRGVVHRIKLGDDAGPLESLAQGQTFLSQVTASPTHVYWGAGSGVMSVPR